MTTRMFGDLQQDPVSTLEYRFSPASDPARGRLLLLHGVGSNERGMVALGEEMPADLEVLAEKADQWLNELGVGHEFKLYPIGHELSGAVVADFVEWLDSLIPA